MREVINRNDTESLFSTMASSADKNTHGMTITIRAGRSDSPYYMKKAGHFGACYTM